MNAKNFGAAVTGDDVVDPKGGGQPEKTKSKAKKPSKPAGLAGITKGKVKKPRRIILYGVDGIGKSTLASNAPSPIFIPTEDGLADIDCESFPHAKSWPEVKQHLTALCKEKHEYKTVVIDSLDWLERLIWGQVCTDNNVASIDEIGYGKGYNAAITIWQEFLRAMDYLRNSKGMGCLLIAHAKVIKFENPEGENYDQYSMALHKLAAPIMREWADEVLFASYKVYTKTKEGDFGREETKAIGGDERILRTREKPYCQAKNRANLPDEIPMSWEAYSACL